MRMSQVNAGMGDLIVFFPIWLTSLILFAAIPTQRSEWPQFCIITVLVEKKFLGDLVANFQVWLFVDELRLVFNKIFIPAGIISQLDVGR